MSDQRHEEAEQEIEVTPEMVREGVRAFSEYDSRFSVPEILVKEIFAAMTRASRLTRDARRNEK